MTHPSMHPTACECEPCRDAADAAYVTLWGGVAPALAHVTAWQAECETRYGQMRQGYLAGIVGAHEFAAASHVADRAAELLRAVKRQARLAA